MKRRTRTHRAPKRGKRTTGATPFKVKHSGVQQKNLVMADETDVKLKFRHVGLNQIAQGPFVYKSFTPNGAYDVDPALGSTETLGFDEYAALYSYYRVISYSYKLQVASNSTTGDSITVYALNTNTAFSGSPNLSLFATTTNCQTKMLAPYGNHSVIMMSGRHLISQILGSKAAETEDNFRAQTTENPADLIWLTIGFESGASTNCACSWILDITMNTRFYGREVDLTLATAAARLNAKLAARTAYDLEKKIRAIKS